MATTGISALGNDQIIAVAALSSKSAAQADVASTASYATLDINGNAITSTYLTAVPAGYATTAWVTGKGYLTAVPAGTMNTASLNTSGGLITGYGGTAFVGGGEVSVTSPHGTININGDEIEGTNSAVITGIAGGYSISLYADNTHIETLPAILTYDTLPDTAQTGGTLVVSLQGRDPSLYITVTGATFGGGTATASGNGSAGSNLIYIPLEEMKGPFTAQATYWVNLSTTTLTASAAPTTGITGVGELAWKNDVTGVIDTVSSNSASWGAGPSYTGDAQGALDEVYSNSGNWNSTYNTVSTNSGSWTGGTTYTAGNCISLTGDIVAWTTNAGITDIVSATALPQNPVSSIIYLIPEA